MFREVRELTVRMDSTPGGGGGGRGPGLHNKKAGWALDSSLFPGCRYNVTSCLLLLQ